MCAGCTISACCIPNIGEKVSELWVYLEGGLGEELWEKPARPAVFHINVYLVVLLLRR